MSAQVVGLSEASQEDKEVMEEEEDDRARRRKGHSKNSSVSERDRKIGHRRINEEGQVSYKKIQTNQLMGSIQLGIQESVGGLAKYPDRDLLMHDFMTVEMCQFPSRGGAQAPPHPYSDFTFRTYAPVAFRYFRDLFGIPPDDFTVSICNETMVELSNPGASGSIFYLSADDEFILKTVSMKEAEFLQKLLPGYYMNLQQNPRTLLPKFFGMFTYHYNQKNIRLIVMNNLLPSNIKMHLKFDLKGSTFKRKASKHEKEKKSPTFKDLDFMDLLPEGLLLEPETYTALISTMRRDCRVLESFKIMDYSLLVGVHNLDMAAREKAEESGVVGSGTDEDRNPSMQRHKLIANSTAMESIQATSDPVDIPGELPPGGIPARNHKGERILLFVGIIDILQSYRLIKKLEHTFKAMIHDGDTVSVHRPCFYAERFMAFMANKIFKKIPSSLKHSPSKRIKPVKPKFLVQGGATSTVGESTDKEDELQQGSGTDHKNTSSQGVALQDLQSDSQKLTLQDLSQPSSSCILPAVLRDRPPGARSGARGAPPPVPPRSPRGRPNTAESSGGRGSLDGVWGGGQRPDVVPPDGGRGGSSCSSSVGRLEDVKLEPRSLTPHYSTDSLGTPSKGKTGRTPTPTWTEGTPSYTESTWSGDTQGEDEP